MTVSGFQTPEFRFLSNFWPSQVTLDDVPYPTVEHAYQAAKTLSLYQRDLIAGLPRPAQAKAAGRRVDLRPDWTAVRLPTMHALLVQKFAPGTPLARRLDATGDRLLVEVNQWGDTFWGVCDGAGENHLGRLLMEIRAANRA